MLRVCVGTVQAAQLQQAGAAPRCGSELSRLAEGVGGLRRGLRWSLMEPWSPV